jgi:nitroreductase
MSTTELNELIRNRRSVFPKTYNSRPIEVEIINQILENANWAPTHKLVQPWKFKVFTGDSLLMLSDYLGDYYKTSTIAEDFNADKHKKSMENPTRSACVIAICMIHDERVPEWENIAAVAAAVQNMWLSCTAFGIGSYWSSPAAALDATTFLSLEEGERCLGLFYMGYSDAPLLAGKRSPIEDKVEWM